MRRLKFTIATLLFSMVAFSVCVAQAQSVSNTQTQKSQHKAAPKTAKKSEAPKQSSSKAPVDPELAHHELQIAEKVHVGHLPCELGASVSMSADEKSPGYFNLQGKGYKYRMKPVATSTGAIRLEDEKAGAVWLQLANKSMLMNSKLGQRMADECQSEQQMIVAQRLKLDPPPSLLDQPTLANK